MVILFFCCSLFFFVILLKLQWSNQYLPLQYSGFLWNCGTVHTQWERTPRNLTWKLSFKLIQSQSFSYWTSIEVVTANTWEHFELLRSTQNQLLKIHNGAKYFEFDFRYWEKFCGLFRSLVTRVKWTPQKKLWIHTSLSWSWLNEPDLWSLVAFITQSRKKVSQLLLSSLDLIHES